MLVYKLNATDADPSTGAPTGDFVATKLKVPVPMMPRHPAEHGWPAVEFEDAGLTVLLRRKLGSPVGTLGHVLPQCYPSTALVLP